MVNTGSPVPPSADESTFALLAPRRGRRGWLRANLSFVVGLALVVGLAFATVVGPFLAQYDPNNGDITQGLQSPSWAHLMGTDFEGRDMFTRVIYGARYALGISVASVLVASFLGTMLGLIAAYFGGLLGGFIMRVLDLVISFPYVVLVIALLATLGPGLTSVAIAVIAVDWTTYGRIIHGQVLTVREREYVEACRAVGVSSPRIMFRHILPNVITPAVVYATLDISQVILLMSALSFLGLGAQPPQSDWGTMVSDGRVYIYSAWWICTFPGLAIMVTGMCFALLGDGLADWLDQRR
jgi:ABC-type dipeptide/oligopeptide/nickel transport system permease subunit